MAVPLTNRSIVDGILPPSELEELRIENAIGHGVCDVHPESNEEQIAKAFKLLVQENPSLQEILDNHQMSDNMEEWTDGEFITFLFQMTPGPPREKY